MTSDQQTAEEFRERIRQLCARAVTADSDELQVVLMELENAIELLQGLSEDEGTGHAARAS